MENQNGIITDHPEGDTTRRLAPLGGLKGCIFPRASRPKLPEVSEVYNRPSSLPICLPALLVDNLTQGLFQGPVGSSSAAEEMRNSHSSLIGRHPAAGPRQGQVLVSPRQSHHNPSTAWVAHKLGEELVRSVPALGLPGHRVGHMKKYGVPTRRDDSPYSRMGKVRKVGQLPTKTCLQLWAR